MLIARLEIRRFELGFSIFMLKKVACKGWDLST